MKKQKFNYVFSLFRLSLSLMIFSGALSAQSNLTIGADLQQISRNGNTPINMIIPNSLNGGYLYLRAEGADGGYRHYGLSGKNSGGGEGATITATFPVGYGVNQLAPGSALRFIIGQKGESRTGGTTAACSGGGGTGIFYKKKDSDQWEILMVAGAGGGAYLDGNLGSLATIRPGNPGVTTEDGQQGDGNGGSGGKNGERGHKIGSKAFCGGGGGGLYVTADDCDYMLHIQGKSAWRARANNDYSILPVDPWGNKIGCADEGAGGDDETAANYVDGGWGCGGGGAGNVGGGGGGGYSGGGGGDNYYGGGGGGSFISSKAISTQKIKNGTTNSPGDGFVEYVLNKDLVYKSIKLKANTAKCIDDMGSRTTNGNNIQLYKCNESEAQSWGIFSDFTIRLGKDMTKCLDLKGSNTANNTNIELYRCNKGGAQKWVYDGLTGFIRYHDNPSKCLTIDNNDFTDGSNIYIYSCSSENAGQKWNVDGVATFDLGEYQVASIRPLKDKGYCIDNEAGGTNNGNNILLWECDDPEGNDNQKWFFDGSTIRLSNHRDKCLDLLGNHTNNNTNIELYDCNGSTAQDWVYGGLTKTIRLKRDLSKCIDLVNGIASNGTNIQIWTCNPNSKNMQWTLEPAEPNPANALFGEIRHVGDNSRCIDLNGNKVANESNIQSWPCHGEAAQRWFVDGKQIKLIENTAYCIDLPHSDTRNDNNIQLYQCHGSANQDWIFDATYQFIRSNIDPNKCIYVNDSYDMRLTTCDYQDPSRMQWTFPGNYSESLDGDNLRIHLAKEEGKCVDMADNEEGSNIRVYTCQTDQSQYFAFDGAAIKRANDPNLCLDIEWGKLDNGTNIRLWHCNDTDAQKWIYDGVSGRIHSKKDPNKCLHIAGDTTTNGSNIDISDCNDGKAERFVIK